jgi:aldehyde dehydrogenase (NAD+)
MSDIKFRSYDSVFIAGEWVKPVHGERNDVVNPATEDVIASVTMAGLNECEQAIRAARQSFNSGVWSNKSAKERADVLDKFVDLIQERSLEISQLIVAEAGHSFGITMQVHIATTLGIVRHQIELMRSDLSITTPISVSPNSMDGGATSVSSACTMLRKPLGVIAAITPFNAAFMLSVIKIVPALAMGNSVVLKGSELTPLEVLVLGDIANLAGIPAGVFSILIGGVDMAEMLTTHHDIDAVSFTGSDRVGAAIMSQSAQSLKRLLLELGGKSASLVLPDADLKTAALFGAASSTVMAGQGCGLTTRQIVHNSVIDAYVERMRRALWAMPIGNPENRFNQMGPLISAQACERSERYVDIALSEGGKVVCGGRRPIHLDKGYFFEPTIITGLSPDSKICQEEIFGPIIAVMGFDTEEEGIAIANNSNYGLSGAVFSRDSGRAFRVASKMETGYCFINAAGVSPSVRGPFGGIKRSGYGKEWGLEGLLEFSYQQTLAFPVC